MKVAIVHDWLTNMGGAEQVVINLHKCFPEAPIYTSFYLPDKMDEEFKKMNIITSSLQKKKDKEYNHKKYLPFLPKAFEEFNLNEYDVVISSCSACSKGIITGPHTLHICYCYTPMRYAWEMRDEYTDGMSKMKTKLIRYFMNYMRLWDFDSAQRVDEFIGISNEVKKRINKHYRREAEVIFPPVRTELFKPSPNDGDYYFVVSRLVKYKRYDLAVQACSNLHKKLVIIGDGPEREHLEALANKEYVTFMGRQPDDVVKKYMSECKALLFPGEEDFGIVPVEAESCGKPVIAFGRGGALDTVVDGKTGILFKNQTVEDLEKAIEKFEELQFDKNVIREHAVKFDEKEFRRQMIDFINEKYKEKMEEV